MAAVRLVEVAAPARLPPGPNGPPGGAGPRGSSRTVRWLTALGALALAVSGIAVVDHRNLTRRAAALEHLVAAGTYLADVGPDVTARWRVTTPAAQVLAVADGAVVTVTEIRGSQLVTARALGTGEELWRSTFALRLGSSRCLGPERAGDAPLVVCALRPHPRALGRDDGGTTFHVRHVRSGELLAERSEPGALLGMRLVDGDLLGAWLDGGRLEVRREDAVTGAVRWYLPLDTAAEVASPSAVGASAAGDELVVVTERDAFAVSDAGTLLFATATAPPRQPRRLALRPVGDGLYAVWRARERQPADLIDAVGGVRLAAIGTPRELVSDDGSLGTVVFTRHPDGDLLWDVPHRTKLWKADGEVNEGLVTDGVLVLASDAGLRVVDPRRGVTLWRAPAGTGLVGVAGELVVHEGDALVGREARTGREVWRSAVELEDGTRFATVGGQLFALEPHAVVLLAALGSP